MRLVRNDELGAEILGAMLGGEFVPPFCAYVIEDKDGVCGACLFNNYEPPTVCLTIASTRPPSLAVVRDIARIAFIGLRCVRLQAKTRASNTRVRKAMKRVGFVEEGVLRKFYGDEDAVICGMLADEQRLIEIDGKTVLP